LNDGGAFGQALAVVELENRNVAACVHGVEIGPVLGPVALGIDLDQRRVEAGFEQGDMGREGAGAGCVIKFHQILLGWPRYEAGGQIYDRCCRTRDKEWL
jgi:hypothetical protein